VSLCVFQSAASAETNFEKNGITTATISEQEYFDNGV
jgi:ketol-acid reductoisomerase